MSRRAFGSNDMLYFTVEEDKADESIVISHLVKNNLTVKKSFFHKAGRLFIYSLGRDPNLHKRAIELLKNLQIPAAPLSASKVPDAKPKRPGSTTTNSNFHCVQIDNCPVEFDKNDIHQLVSPNFPHDVFMEKDDTAMCQKVMVVFELKWIAQEVLGQLANSSVYGYRLVVQYQQLQGDAVAFYKPDREDKIKKYLQSKLQLPIEESAISDSELVDGVD